jgi:hypothetical protein
MIGRLAAALVMLAGSVPAPALTLTAADRLAVVSSAAALLEARYVDAEAGARLAKRLREHRFSANADPARFAGEVTAFLRDASGDGHLGLSYSKAPIAPEGGESAFGAGEMLRYYGPQLNHGVERIERLPGNVMLLDLRVFPPPAMAGDVIAAAMTLVAQGSALIIDLRRNGGGTDSGNLIAGYLLDGAQPLSGSYDRPTDRTTPSRSPVWVPGRRFGAAKPVYILTSGRTFSAAESLAYDLQALKRAVIVGEVTGGGAHPFEYRRVHPHFALDLPEGRSVNPLTGGNWQGVGVQPDVRVPADQALETALALARTAIKDRPADGSGLPALP